MGSSPIARFRRDVYALGLAGDVELCSSVDAPHRQVVREAHEGICACGQIRLEVAVLSGRDARADDLLVEARERGCRERSTPRELPPCHLEIWLQIVDRLAVG